MTATSTTPTEAKRRRQRAAQAVTGTRGKEVGTAKDEAAGAVRVSTDRRFIMMGHTVKIVNPREDWSELRGSYATVENQWGDGSVCVKVTRPGRDGSTRICFAREEIEMVPINDPVRHADTEEYNLIGRASAFEIMPKWGGSDKAQLSEALKAAVIKRAERLTVQIRAIQRLKEQDLRTLAKWMACGLGNYCTAVVPYTGGTEA